jgi:hypothetical protein
LHFFDKPKTVNSNMGFKHRKMEDRCRDATQKEAADRRATDDQVLENAERLIAAWNERQAKRMSTLFLADDRRSHHHRLLVPVSPVLAVPAPSTATRGGHQQPHSGTVLALMPAARLGE